MARNRTAHEPHYRSGSPASRAGRDLRRHGSHLWGRHHEWGSFARQASPENYSPCNSDDRHPDHPDLVNSLARHVEPLVKFFICNGYLCIRDLDANMSGTQDIHQHLALNGFYAATVWILVKEVLALGPSLLLLLLERKRRFSTAKDFMIWAYRLRRDPEPQDMNGRHHILLFLSDIFRWIQVEHRKRWRDRVDDFGIKNPGNLDLTQWAKAFPDEDTWADSMFQWRWIGPEQSVRKLLRLPSQA
jgi:hypothetical protein